MSLPSPNPLRRDLRSKILDGLLPGLILYLLLEVILFSLVPIRAYFNGPGLLVYTLGLLAVGMFSLQRALSNGMPESTRAWYGMAAGVLVWAVVEISAMLDAPSEPGLRSAILLILASLVGALLWRGSLPLGGRFFWITVCANWTGSMLIQYLQKIAAFSPALTLLSRVTGLIAAASAMVLTIWVFLASQRRVQRIWASLVIVLLSVFAIYMLHGSF